MTASNTPTGTPYGTLPSASPLPRRKPVSLPRLQQRLGKTKQEVKDWIDSL